MEQKRWIIVVEKYEGFLKTATDLLASALASQVKYVVPVKKVDDVSDAELAQNNVMTVGRVENNRLMALCESKGLLSVPKESEGYAIYVGENPLNADTQAVAVAGYDEKGAMYGAVDFCNKYCGTLAHQRGYLFAENFFADGFNVQMPAWSYAVAPAIKTRAIWTWGHVIYDYKRFFENMLKLRLNEIVIWNDCVPFNAKDVVAYAHSLGIKVVWGFAWGWDAKCSEITATFDEQYFRALKEQVLNTYANEYAGLGGDGIYFQSFTEIKTDTLNGVCVADVVTDLVNEIAGELLARYPSLHIQFGLHATSVKTHLDVLKKVDNRVCIVWEDCGAFPYSYGANDTDSFDETAKLVEELLTLRGEKEYFGSVLKGMPTLDWQSFEHFSAPYVLGERTDGYMRERLLKKNKTWKFIQSAWLKNAEYARKMVSLIAEKGDNPIMQALVEDAMFECGVPFPIAFLSEVFWTPDAPVGEMVEFASNYPCVQFANL